MQATLADKKQKEILDKITSGEITPQEALNKFEVEATHISEISIDDIEVTVLECGFPTFDDMLVFKKNRGELIILGARPSHGKSAFMFQVAQYVAKSENVLIYSLEMDKESIKSRMIAGSTGYGLTKIQKGQVPKAIIEQARDELNELKFWVDDRPLDVRSIRSSANAFHRHHPVSLVVVDYLQIVRSRDRANRNEEVGDISSELKAMAKDLKCPVLVGAQLNRNCENRGKQSGDFSPILADLRESGNIEADADVVLFLGRAEMYEKGVRPGTADFKIAKNRNGPTGDLTVSYFGGKCRFEENKFAIRPKSPHSGETL